MTIVFRTFAAVVVTLVVAACAPRTVPASEAVRNVPSAFVPTLLGSPAGARLVRLDPPGAGASFVAQVPTDVTNPNADEVRLTSIAFTLYIADDVVAEGVMPLDVRLPSGARTEVVFDVAAALPEDSPAWAALLGAEPIAFEFEGRVAFRTDRVTAVPVAAPRWRGVLAPAEVAPPLLLTVEREHTWLDEVGRTRVGLALAIANPGDVGYFLGGRALTLALLPASPLPPTADELARAPTVAALDLPPFAVPAGATVALPLDVAIAESGGDAGTLLRALRDGRGVRFALRGALAYDVLGRGSYLVADDPLTWGALTTEARLR